MSVKVSNFRRRLQFAMQIAVVAIVRDAIGLALLTEISRFFHATCFAV
jgi:hypothetical protein